MDYVSAITSDLQSPLLAHRIATVCSQYHFTWSLCPAASGHFQTCWLLYVFV